MPAGVSLSPASALTLAAAAVRTPASMYSLLCMQLDSFPILCYDYSSPCNTHPYPNPHRHREGSPHTPQKRATNEPRSELKNHVEGRGGQRRPRAETMHAGLP